ncbi:MULTISPECIES: DUF305 domain-containing protein [Streptomyces]|uniref:DUF305 domain-containing protein n=1 Tax=Streptomyces TaxID=1883 RepID=UPI000565B6DD|nr:MULTISPECIES: DUF305 domain-containing protein [Streptomyces]AKL65105.1 lipoprotein [Streptomyces sp. Mg1]WSR97838.1 DUF305 domain-containing protein [Streptomyces goshikiensis]WSY01123.1 DUF305 domain-containing protein [Streptomyces goshikiensis]
MDMAKGLLRGLAGAAVVSATLLALAGCQDDDGKTGANGAKDGRNPVIAPGKPGERARTLSPEQAARERPDDTPNAADQTYVRGMIEHHRQALTMSALAPDRASAEAVKGLAERIAAAQKPEIGAMERWLARYPAPGGAGAAGGAGGTGGMGGHDHGAMPGMATEQQLKELADARGTDFDRLFLKLMTAHHEGALKMAGQALAGGNNVAVEEMATEVVATQTAEIHRMRALG